MPTSDIPPERGEGELSQELQPAIQDQVEQRQPPREDVDMDFSSSSVEKRGSGDTVDSESGAKKPLFQEAMLARIQTEVEVSEDASEQRVVWTPDGYLDEAQLQAGIQQELQAMKSLMCTMRLALQHGQLQRRKR